MRRKTKEELLRNKENNIKTLIKSGDRLYVQTHNFLYNYYFFKTATNGTPLMTVFEAIYIKNLSLPAWKLANYCHVSRTTLFNYRNEIVNNFNICLQKSFPIPEIVYTEG